jgi:uroporphyrinogen-III decarboxylase
MLALGCGMPLNTPSENIHALVAANRKFGGNILESTRLH